MCVHIPPNSLTFFFRQFSQDRLVLSALTDILSAGISTINFDVKKVGKICFTSLQDTIYGFQSCLSGLHVRL